MSVPAARQSGPAILDRFPRRTRQWLVSASFRAARNASTAEEFVAQLQAEVEHAQAVARHLDHAAEVVALGRWAKAKLRAREIGRATSRRDEPERFTAADLLVLRFCPKCNGEMWDNRQSKRNPRSPDYRCKSRTCDGALWLTPKPA